MHVILNQMYFDSPAQLQSPIHGNADENRKMSVRDSECSDPASLIRPIIMQEVLYGVWIYPGEHGEADA